MELSWALPAIASPLVYAVISLGDKWMLTNLKLRIESFNLFVGCTQLVTGGVVLAVLGFPDSPLSSVGYAYAGGMLWGVGLILFFWALQREQIGRVVPVSQTSPIFAAFLGVFFLGENIEWWGWLAVLLVVGGAVIVSANPQQVLSGGFSKIYLYVVVGAAIIGFAQLLLKESSGDLNVWHNLAFRGLGLFNTLGLPFVRPSVIRDLQKIMTRPRAAIPIVIIEGIGPVFGNGLLLLALANGPVSLVSALLGTRPVFVLLLTFAFAPIAKREISEKFSRVDIATKTISVAAVVGGVAIIAFA